MKVQLTDLNVLINKALLRYGYTQEEAVIISEVLLYAQLRGNNQGIVKLIGKGIPKSANAGTITIEKESPVSALINGTENHAMVVVNQATDLAIQKAKQSGIAIVGINHINTSSGALGFYAKKIADAGLAGIVFAGSMETVAAEGSSEAVFGTNPLAIAVPSEKEPMVLDMTTAAMAYFGVVEADTAGRMLPEGIAYDKEGNPTIKPSDVLDGGSIRSFDQSHKGSGLSMMVQAFTGPLMGAYFTGVGDVAGNWGGHFILAVNPDLFMGAEAMKKGVTQMIEKVKSTKKLPGIEEIYVPGERGNKLTQETLSSGEIEIEDNLYAGLEKVAG